MRNEIIGIVKGCMAFSRVNIAIKCWWMKFFIPDDSTFNFRLSYEKEKDICQDCFEMPRKKYFLSHKILIYDENIH